MRFRLLVLLVVAAIAALPSCRGSEERVAPAPSTRATSTTTTAARPRALRILVTNDDGVGADGIDALVEALRKLPDTDVTVVATRDNRSGTGSKLTPGGARAASSTTKSGFPATAVDGYPVDSMVYALDRASGATPHLVISGINAGQNVGVLVDASGTVGAARAAAQRGVPALAVSQSLGDPPDYASGVRATLAWIAAHRAALLGRDLASTAPASLTNLNIPTCPAGRPRAVVITPLAGADAKPFDPIDCTTPYGRPVSDVDALLHGYIAQTNDVPLSPAAK